MPADPDHPWLSAETDRILREALLRRAAGDSAEDALRAALGRVCEEGHRGGLTAEHVIMALRITWSRIPPPAGLAAEAWADVYKRAVAACLKMFSA
jgi:hypothetical protein